MNSTNKKLTILCVLKVLQEYTDENHCLTQNEIANKIDSLYGIECERKSIAFNLQCLEDFGFDIQKVDRKGYFLGEREVEPSEITFLIDAIFSSKTLTSEQAKSLANKVSSFLSKYQKKKYDYVYKSNEITRSNNKELFYNIDIISEAIENNKQISFTYNKYGVDKKLHARSNKEYIINPYFMVNNQGKYYLVCNYDYYDEIANYKIDQISNIKIIDSSIKPVNKLKDYENGIDISKYINENVYMFGGKTITATFKAEDEYGLNQIIEWFSNSARAYTKDNINYVDVTANELTLVYWALQYGEYIELVAPIEIRDLVKKQLNSLILKYKD